MELMIREWTATGPNEEPNYIRTLSHLKSFSYKAQSNNTSDLRFGAIVCPVLTFEVFYDANQTPVQKGNWVTLDIKNNVITSEHESSEWTHYGAFRVRTVTDNKTSYIVTCTTFTSELNVDYSARLKYLADSGSFPMSVSSLIYDAIRYVGSDERSWSDPSGAYVPDVNQFYASGITVADIVSAVAAFWGRFAIPSSSKGRTESPSFRTFVELRAYAAPYIQYTDGGALTREYVLIAPTDGEVDTSAFDKSFYKQIYYKEDGFSAEDPVNAVNYYSLVRADGQNKTVDESNGDEVNEYRISNNLIADNLDSASIAGYTLTSLKDALATAFGSPIYRPSTIHLFPFYSPLHVGDIVYVTNGDGISYSMPIMSMEINDYETIISCTGNEHYDTAQNQYTTPEDVGIVNSSNIEDLRKNKADLSALADGHVRFVYKALEANESATFNVENSTKFVLFASGAAANSKGVWIYNTTSSGALSVKEVASASNVTRTAATNALTISTSAAAFFVFFVFNGSVTETGGS